MGQFVKVAVSFEGIECSRCEFEDGVGLDPNLGEQSNYCSLFSEYKRGGLRCESCIECEESETE